MPRDKRPRHLRRAAPEVCATARFQDLARRPVGSPLRAASWSGLARLSAGGEQLGRSQQLAAEVLQAANAGHRSVDPSPAYTGPVQHGPDQRQAGVLAGQPPDHLDPAPALAEGPLQEVRVADALAMLDREGGGGR
jgi:hypothetical protein